MKNLTIHSCTNNYLPLLRAARSAESFPQLGFSDGTSRTDNFGAKGLKLTINGFSENKTQSLGSNDKLNDQLQSESRRNVLSVKISFSAHSLLTDLIDNSC